MSPVWIIALVILVGTYAAWRVRYGPRPAGPRVLCFHKVTRRFCLEGTWTTPARFEAALDAVERAGFRWVDETEYRKRNRCLSDDHDAVRRGALCASETSSAVERDTRIVWLTFDDAYEDVYRYAFPILRRRGIPFHLFVVSGYAGRDNTWEIGFGRPAHRHATWEQLAEMVRGGATVGSHTETHADLTRALPCTLRNELVRSRETIEEMLGCAVRTLSYPFGRSDRRVRLAAAAAGYDAAFSLYPGRRNAVADPMALRRDAVYVIDPAFLVPWKLGTGPLAVFEEMKCRAIHSVAALTPLVTSRRQRGPG